MDYNGIIKYLDCNKLLFRPKMDNDLDLRLSTNSTDNKIFIFKIEGHLDL